MGNLHEISLKEACERFRQRVAIYLADKRDKIDSREFTELDYFPCWYCLKYLGKTSWLDNFPNHPWKRVKQNPYQGDSKIMLDQKVRTHVRKWLIQSSTMERSFFFIWRAKRITA